MADGWIRIHRSIQQNWIWKDPIKFSWWMDILLNVNYSDSKVNIGFELYDCKRGQSIMSLQSWADRWKVSKDTARNFLRLLEKDGMILHEGLGKTTRITVCKYEEYQSDLHDEQTKCTRKANASSPIKEREERKEEEEYIPQKFNFKKALISIGVSEQVASDWMAVRKNKKATNTETAFNSINREIEKCTLSPDDCIRYAVEKSWQGFKAEWVKDNERKAPVINPTYERWDGKKRWLGSIEIPYDAPPRPNNLAKWDSKQNKWIHSNF